MIEEYKLIQDELPEKGKDIIGIDEDGNERCCFRCACHNDKCIEWRCSITGYGLLINIVKWKYE
jgi:hypothetical protein